MTDSVIPFSVSYMNLSMISAVIIRIVKAICRLEVLCLRSETTSVLLPNELTRIFPHPIAIGMDRNIMIVEVGRIPNIDSIPTQAYGNSISAL